MPCNSYGDCVSDCKAALSAADKLIANLKDEISTRTKLEEAQQKQIVDLSAKNEKDQVSLDSWSRNPFVIGCIGFGVGAIATAFLLKH